MQVEQRSSVDLPTSSSGTILSLAEGSATRLTLQCQPYLGAKTTVQLEVGRGWSAEKEIKPRGVDPWFWAEEEIWQAVPTPMHLGSTRGRPAMAVLHLDSRRYLPIWIPSSGVIRQPVGSLKVLMTISF